LPNSEQRLGKSTTSKICEVCNKRLADGLLDRSCMVCFRKEQFSQMPPVVQKKTLLEVVPERYIEAKMDDVSGKLRADLEKDVDTGVLMWGSPGVGKTYTMAALAKKYLSEGYLVKRVHYETLCLQLRDTYNPKATQTEWQIIEPLLNCDKLFIEDVGTTKSIGVQESDFSLRTFLVLLDMRLERCRPTFITSNKTVENLTKSFDERIGDRLRTFLVCDLGTKSKRNEIC